MSSYQASVLYKTWWEGPENRKCGPCLSYSPCSWGNSNSFYPQRLFLPFHGWPSPQILPLDKWRHSFGACLNVLLSFSFLFTSEHPILRSKTLQDSKSTSVIMSFNCRILAEFNSNASLAPGHSGKDEGRGVSIWWMSSRRSELESALAVISSRPPPFSSGKMEAQRGDFLSRCHPARG